MLTRVNVPKPIINSTTIKINVKKPIMFDLMKAHILITNLKPA